MRRSVEGAGRCSRHGGDRGALRDTIIDGITIVAACIFIMVIATVVIIIGLIITTSTAVIRIIAAISWFPQIPSFGVEPAALEPLLSGANVDDRGHGAVGGNMTGNVFHHLCDAFVDRAGVKCRAAGVGGQVLGQNAGFSCAVVAKVDARHLQHVTNNTEFQSQAAAAQTTQGSGG